jgi:hypothetical protein
LITLAGRISDSATLAAIEELVDELERLADKTEMTTLRIAAPAIHA